MDVIIAVLEDLQRQENPCVCEEEIEDLYCMKCRANNLITLVSDIPELTI